MSNRIILALTNTVLIISIVLVIGISIKTIRTIVLNLLALVINPRLVELFINKLTFIGVMHHELSHALFAFITGAKINRVELFKLDTSSGLLGYVTYRPRGGIIIRSIQRTLASLAPSICGICSVYLLYNKFNVTTNIGIFIKYYLIISIAIHSVLSKYDIKEAFKGLHVCSLILFIIMYTININIIDIMIV